MLERNNEEDSLLKAGKLERAYNWAAAADLYTKALRTGAAEDGKAAEVGEKVGYCSHRAAFQAKTREEFLRRIRLSVEAYEEAASLFEKAKDSKMHARSVLCRAKASRIKSCLAEGSERKTLLQECWELENKALRAFAESGDRLHHGKMCNEVLYCLFDRSRVEWDGEQLGQIVEEAVKCGEAAIDDLSQLEDERELTKAYSLTSFHCYYGANIGETEEKMKELGQKCLNYAKEALKLSEKVGDSYLIGLSNWAASRAFLFSGNITLSMKHAQEMLRQGMTIQDNYIMGVACHLLSWTTSWIWATEEDPDKVRKGYSEAIRFAEDAICHLRIIASDYFLALTPLAGNYFFLASKVETSPKQMRVLLNKAIEAGRKSIEYAERSSSPEAIGTNLHELSKVLFSLSKMETKASEKKKLLEEACKHREGYIDIVESVYPSNYWVQGVGQNYHALIKAELAEMEPEKEKQRELLEEAVSRMKKCLRLIEKWAKLHPQTRYFAVLGEYYHWFGSILDRLYQLSEDQQTLKRIIGAYEKSAGMYRKSNLPSRLAEAHWKLAGTCDRIGEYSKASENFESAAGAYKESAKRMQRLEGFYSDYATYMQAWIEIENAKHCHVNQKYGLAQKSYEKAAKTHQNTKSWKYLAPNYLAWAQIDHAEDLSRGEHSQKAIMAFRKAIELFREAKRTLRLKLAEIENADENDLAKRLAKASDVRVEYCSGRIALEEARILDRQGDHAASSRKYGAAAEIFQNATIALEDESDRKELQPIICLSRAWQMMTLAESEASPDLYLEASRLFDEAKGSSSSEQAKVLALGHSSFCKALEAGTRFEATRDTTLYSDSIRFLESAASYYLRAGFETASEYAKATQHLFDAYVYMDNASKETDPEEKLKYYSMAGKTLQASIKSYRKAKHSEKSQQVKRILKKVREEKELAMSLSEVLHVPKTTSSTASFFTPTPSEESAVGLEEFEHAKVQASLVLRVEEIMFGEDIDVELELFNTGKAHASLIQVEQMIPEGFDLVRAPDAYRVESHRLNMKGKRLDPLKTEEVRLTLRPTSKGTFHVAPRIVYLDETGKRKSHKPEPATIAVRELGIKDWIKGK